MHLPNSQGVHWHSPQLELRVPGAAHFCTHFVSHVTGHFGAFCALPANVSAQSKSTNFGGLETGAVIRTETRIPPKKISRPSRLVRVEILHVGGFHLVMPCVSPGRASEHAASIEYRAEGRIECRASVSRVPCTQTKQMAKRERGG